MANNNSVNVRKHKWGTTDGAADSSTTRASFGPTTPTGSRTGNEKPPRETVLFTHQPTFDHCQQLLGILFTIEERGRILEHARKLVPGPTGDPLTDPAVITAAFPSTHPNWDYNAAEGKESLRVYRQALLAGLKAVARKPTNMAKVYDIRQGVDESLAAYLERLMTAFKQYTPYDPESPMTTQVVILAYINQAAPDIRKKLQSLDRLEERNLRELVAVAEKVQGATGTKSYSWTTQRTVDLGMGKVTHSFLVIPECPYPLLGRDLLSKMRAQIHFSDEGAWLMDQKRRPIQVLLTTDLVEEYRLHLEPEAPGQEIQAWLQKFPLAWAETGGMGLAKHRPPVYVEIKSDADPVKVRQYPMSLEAKKGITPHIRRLLSLGVLRPIQSAWNTPLLPVKKPHTGDYRSVQDLREVNKRVVDIHPTVPNPYTLLSSLPPDRQWYSVLDLKDAFFSLPLALKSQPHFAFEWHDPEIGIGGQLTWTRLPQGFKNSPTIFDEALREDLGEYRTQNPDISLLQYVDDLLIAGKDKKLNIYTDSRYAFATAHIHGAIYLERGLLTAEGKTIKNKQEILELLKALWAPKKLAIMHCPGHQKGEGPIQQGNNLADQTARQVAMMATIAPMLVDPGAHDLPPLPQYTDKDEAWARSLPMTHLVEGWGQIADDKIILPQELGRTMLRKNTLGIPPGNQENARSPQTLCSEN
ncbi:uncharacterized protein LOC121825602 [Peromyscus maniculatus bairdii]|uniref:uncharacterized protein LOC121825602 n=1 Tax=Peromyscus maniculatus bairdii TaxID=230844 RepID=UPI003FD20C86